VKEIPQAASILLAQDPESAKLFFVRRAESLRFFGGFHAFPGGKVAPADADAPAFFGAAAPRPAPELTRIVTAARELFEETGVLIARGPDGLWSVAPSRLEQLRRELLAEGLSFGDILAELGVHLAEADFVPLGSLVTPPFTSIRFDTCFYLAFLPAGQKPEVWKGELDRGFWATPAALLERWRHADCLISPPTIMILEALGEAPAREAAERLRPVMKPSGDESIPPILYAPHVRLLPLRTDALPPSTHTNAYLVGHDPAVLLDPGATGTGEQARLFQALDELAQQGLNLQSIVLSHHHPDHTGAAAACAERYRVPVRAHAATAQALADKLPVQGDIVDGTRLDLGAAPAGTGRWHLEAIHTPGHARGHLVFYEPRYRLLFAGDMVSTQSSVVIAPSEGDLGQYLESLRRLRGYDSRLLLPAHGPASARPRQTIDDALEHRAKREEALVTALRLGPRHVADLVEELYRGVPENLLKFARCQVVAGLQKLEREGRAQPVGDGTAETWCQVG
jgi:glyoxylase-like metal-dependent hydrolase (beta-lactamase superfamily II)/8-oxo-dGTP pyrophosphatase MutT (NUDIX family)